MHIRPYFLLIFLLPLLSLAEVKITRLDHALMQDELPDSILLPAEKYLHLTRQSLTDYDNSASTTLFQPLIDSLLPTLESQEETLSHLAAYLEKNLPQARVGKVYGVILPYNQAIVTIDSTIFVGLNHYLGQDNPIYADFPQFQHRTKQPDTLPLQVAETLIRRAYTTDDSDETLITRMLYNGLIANVLSQATGLTLDQVQQFTPGETKWMLDNETQAWNALIHRDLLYSAEPQVIDMLTSAAPASSILHPEAPAQMPNWIGARIVSQYLQRTPNVKISSLFSPEFLKSPVKVLQRAHYNPGNN